MQKLLKLILKMMMLFALSLSFSGCSFIKLTTPKSITLPLLGKYHKQLVVVKKQYIQTTKRKIYKLPSVPTYKMRNIVEDGEYRVSVSNIEMYKGQKNCALKTKRLKQYEYMVTHNE